MPDRTPEERKLIDSLKKIKPTDTCNARTGKGYCKMKAGFRTDHVGTGRCYLHGGRNPGAPVTHGLYSKKLKSTIRKEYDKLATDPILVDLRGELALTKSLLSRFIENITDSFDGDFNWMVQQGKNSKEISAEAQAFLKIVDQLRKIYKDIASVENAQKNNLTRSQIFITINQIKVVMNDTCGSCPVRRSIAHKLDDVKMVPVEEANIVEESPNK